MVETVQEANFAIETEKALTLSLQAQVDEQARQHADLQAPVQVNPDNEMDLEDWKKETMALGGSKQR